MVCERMCVFVCVTEGGIERKEGREGGREKREKERGEDRRRRKK